MTEGWLVAQEMFRVGDPVAVLNKAGVSYLKARNKMTAALSTAYTMHFNWALFNATDAFVRFTR